MHPNLFKSIKRKCKTIPIVKDTVLQSVDGNELPEEGRFIIKNAISFENEKPKDISVVLTKAMPVNLLLGLPELRKWNTVVLHSSDPDKEGLLVDIDSLPCHQLMFQFHMPGQCLCQNAELQL